MNYLLVNVNMVEKNGSPRKAAGQLCHVRRHGIRTAKKQHLQFCRCLKNGMDLGAVTILSMTIIAWAFLPVNRNAVPVCEICAPNHCQRENVWKITVYFVELQTWERYNMKKENARMILNCFICNLHQLF